MPTASWTAPAHTGGSPVTGYTLHMLTTSGAILTVDSTTTSIELTDAMAAANGTFWVTATNAFGVSQIGAEATYVAPDTSPQQAGAFTVDHSTAGAGYAFTTDDNTRWCALSVGEAGDYTLDTTLTAGTLDSLTVYTWDGTGTLTTDSLTQTGTVAGGDGVLTLAVGTYYLNYAGTGATGTTAYAYVAPDPDPDPDPDPGAGGAYASGDYTASAGDSGKQFLDNDAPSPLWQPITALTAFTITGATARSYGSGQLLIAVYDAVDGTLLSSEEYATVSSYAMHPVVFATPATVQSGATVYIKIQSIGSGAPSYAYLFDQANAGATSFPLVWQAGAPYDWAGPVLNGAGVPVQTFATADLGLTVTLTAVDLGGIAAWVGTDSTYSLPTATEFAVTDDCTVSSIDFYPRTGVSGTWKVGVATALNAGAPTYVGSGDWVYGGESLDGATPVNVPLSSSATLAPGTTYYFVTTYAEAQTAPGSGTASGIVTQPNRVKYHNAFDQSSNGNPVAFELRGFR